MNRRTFLAAVSAVPVLAAGDILIDNTPVRKPNPLDAFVRAIYDIARDYPCIRVVETGTGPLRRCADTYSHELRLAYTAGKQTCFSVAWLPDKYVYDREKGLESWRAIVRDLFDYAEETQQRGGFA
jgi:hypothetical protein